MRQVFPTLLLFLLSSLSFAQMDSTHFVTTWDTRITNSGDSLTIEIPALFPASSYSYDVDWNNDGVFDTTGVTISISHTYATPGIYTVRIKGDYNSMDMHLSPYKDKLISIDQWGNGDWYDMYLAFSGCSNLGYTATDVPKFAGAVSCGFMFQNCTQFNGDLSNWDVSNVIDMDGMFWGATSFNQDISVWDVSSVTSMNNMFEFATSFNQDLGDWDVSSVTRMNSMFYNTIFSGDSLGKWDVSAVTDMGNMFGSTINFNGAISNWDVSSVTNMSFMFNGADKFDQNLGEWDISSVTNMTGMFSKFFPSQVMSLSNYDSTLIGWQQNAHQMNVSLGAMGLEYCLGDSARALLIADGWNISGDSKNCLVGLEENTVESLQFFPNPSSGMIHLKNQNINSMVRVFNMRGKLVLEILLEQEVLDLSALTKGIYMLEIEGKRAKLSLTD